MKLFSQFLKNITINFPIGHGDYQRASSQLGRVLRLEAEGNEAELVKFIESWGLDPLNYSVDPLSNKSLYD